MISVCMATYNGEKYIREQVDSILCQLGSSDEIVISDDGSRDSTLAILTSYHDTRIKIHHNAKRKGVVGNFENALSNAVGDYIFLSDQDDVWLAGKVEKCMIELQNVDLVLHDAQIWSGDTIINSSFFEYRHSKPGYWKNLVRNSYIGCCMAFTSRIRDAVLPFPKEIAMHDMYIGLKTERKFNISFIETPLLKYRRHGENASATGEKSNLSRSYQIIYRLKMLAKTIF